MWAMARRERMSHLTPRWRVLPENQFPVEKGRKRNALTLN